jgi:hypothetical protein
MNVNVIQKPLPHCPIPYGHPLFTGFVPAAETDIRKTWQRATGIKDDYELVLSHDWLSDGGFAK